MSKQATAEDINATLGMLNPDDDGQWTSDGLPLMETMRGITGDEKLTREQVTAAAPEFSREVAARANGGEGSDKQEEAREVTITELDEAVNVLRAEADDIAKKIEVLERQRNKLYARTTGGYDHREDTKARLEYIRKQNELRAARVAKAKEVANMVKSAGVRKSPLDAAMERKTARGTQRPTFGSEPKTE